jgi:hypothetical protein
MPQSALCSDRKGDDEHERKKDSEREIDIV